jgi:hypothetical protein
MGFPSYFELIWHYNVFLLTGPFFLYLSFRSWTDYLSNKGSITEYAHTKVLPKRLFPVIGISLIALAHMGLYTSVYNAISFRVFPLESAQELIIEKIDNRYEPKVLALARIGDQDIIRNGIRQLGIAKSRHVNHERLSDGYRFLFLDKSKPSGTGLYVSLFRASNTEGVVHVVIPHRGPASEGAVNHAGTYSSPEFDAWTREYVDPLFGKKEPRGSNQAL